MEDLLELLLELAIYGIDSLEQNRRIKLKKDLKDKINQGLEYNEKEFYLYLVIMMFLFYAEDSKFTFDERNLIKKELRKRKKDLSKKEYKLFKAVFYKVHFLSDITRLILTQDYNYITIQRVLRDVKDSIFQDEEYLIHLEELETELLSLV